GVSVGTNGFGISAAMANAHGDANSDAAIQNASHVTGANSVAIVSGGDTNVIGSQIAGRQIAADVGGNLNIASVQDTTVSAAHQSSAGGGFAISQSGGGASFSAQNGHADGSYAQVKEQAGLVAGDGGFDVSVKGNTALIGAVIAGADDAAKNSLSTGTLTFADVGNHSHYSANSIGGSVGLSPGPSSEKAVGTASVPGSGGPVPMIGQHENGDQSSTTRSAISPGTIMLTDSDHQAQDIASLSRDMTNTNGTVATTPDVNEILNKQADTMQAAQAAGQVVAQGIGAYADGRRDEAIEGAKSAYYRGDLDAMQSYLDTADAWSDGGLNNRAALHVIGGGMIGGLGVGSIGGAAGGAAGAGLSSYMGGHTRAFADSVGGGLVGNLTGNVVNGVGGVLIGGPAGAATASSLNLYNQQNDKNETQAAKDQKELRKILDQERAALGQRSIQQADNGAATLRPPVGALGGTPKIPVNLQPFSNPPQAPIIPSSWESRDGRSPGSTIYYPPGTDPSAPGSTYIRVMPPGTTPVPGLQEGYWISVRDGQPINPATGGTGTKGDTHIPLPPNSLPPKR
ncbi:hemagglutinin repeat-containing protein, partial [Caballeronia sp. LZ033]|uniref:hemagglutinin repeat-containing protein n=1 Tax=Caballeronia sp. LZ033 TaxID=3038566 RepID=UPI002856418F